MYVFKGRKQGTGIPYLVKISFYSIRTSFIFMLDGSPGIKPVLVGTDSCFTMVMNQYRIEFEFDDSKQIISLKF